MFLSILCILLISFLLNYLFSSFFGVKGTILLSCFNIFLCFCIVVYMFIFKFLISEFVTVEIINLGNWLSIFYLEISWSFLVDSLTIIMLLIIFTISLCVHLYSVYYMKTDKNIVKFFSYITLFTFFMSILVSSANFIVLFLGWEGVGLCSFLLISFWTTRVQANKAALKAMLINRIGDFFILMAIVLIILTFKTVDFLTIFAQVDLYSLKSFGKIFNINLSIIDIICFCLAIGSITKSAQLGFHGWLPDAMEGPTPVSALIHAATMVTAGVFLIIRCSYLFEFSTLALTMLIYFGALTIVLFGIVGLCQFDIKKIVAYSTCSQLGYMILACGLSGYNFALFHLFTHASFKALLFLASGTFIHIMNNEQDIRKLNGMFERSPLTSICFIIGLFSLIGFPFLSGFFSKDAIIELSFTYYQNPMIFFFALAGVCLTALYSSKIFYYLFIKLDNNKINKSIMLKYSFNIFNFGPLIFLSLLSIFIGYFFKELFLGIGNNFFYGSILSFLNPEIIELEFIHSSIKVLPLLFTLTYIFIFFDFMFFFKENPDIYYVNHSLLLFFSKGMFFDSLINLFLNFYIYKLAYKIFYLFDKGILETLGPSGFSYVNMILYFKIRKLYVSGQLQNSIFTLILVMVWLMLIIFFLFSYDSSIDLIIFSNA